MLIKACLWVIMFVSPGLLMGYPPARSFSDIAYGTDSGHHTYVPSLDVSRTPSKRETHEKSPSQSEKSSFIQVIKNAWQRLWGA